MSRANTAFVQKDYSQGINSYLQVIQFAPNTHEAYSILGIMYKEMGDLKKSFNYSLISLHLSGADYDQWKQLAKEAIDLGLSNESIYCLSRAIRKDSKDVDSLWQRLVLYHQRRDRRRVVESCVLILKAIPFQPFAIRLVVHFCLALNEPLRLISVFEKMLLVDDTADHERSSWLFFHTRFLCRLYAYIGDYERLYSALPNIVIWMRKLKNRVKTLGAPQFIVPEEHKGMFRNLNSLQTPFDIIMATDDLDGGEIASSSVKSWIPNDSDEDDRESISTVEDALLPPLDDGGHEQDIIMDPLSHFDEWFFYLPTDLQGYYIISSVHATASSDTKVPCTA